MSLIASLGQWFVPWEPSVTVVMITVFTAVFYVRGGKIAKPTLWQRLFFWTGFATIYFVLHTEFDYYAEHAFFMHRLQHSVLHHLGPMLLALSNPWACLFGGLPKRARIFLQATGNNPIMRQLIEFAMNPIVITALFIGLLCFWLIPSVHFVAMLDWRLYRLMNWGMLINGCIFWWLALSHGKRNRVLSCGARAAMLLAIIPPQIITGAIIFYAGYDLYPVYTLCGRAFDGMTPMADQQTGGLVLWIMGAMMSVIGIIIVLGREMALRTRHNANGTA